MIYRIVLITFYVNMSLYEKYKLRFFREMAHAGEFGDFSVDIYTDHTPPHFHVNGQSKDKNFEVRIAVIPKIKRKILISDVEVISYKRQRRGEFTTADKRDLVEWLNAKNSKMKTVINNFSIINAWNFMNSKSAIEVGEND